MILSLTLLHNVHLESCNVTYKVLLSPFMAADVLLELLAVPFEVCVASEKLVDRCLARCQPTVFAIDWECGHTGADCSFSNSALTFASFAFRSSKSASICSFFLAIVAQFRRWAYVD